MSAFLGVAESTIVFVPNATTGINTVLRNLVWNTDGKDEILQFDVIYGACGKTTNYVCEANRDIVRTREIAFEYPVDDATVVSAFRKAIETSRIEGFRPRIAIFDTISSNPGLRFPFEELTAICHAEGVLSLIDAAHGIGQIELDLPLLNPDFLISNCHKWMFTPRGCAVFYVPERNQAMMRSTLPTSHGFIARSSIKDIEGSTNGAPKKTEFESNFEFVGTTDNFAFLTIADAIQWRQTVCGGEKAIQEYCVQLCRKGGQRVAEILGTNVLENRERSSSNCFMVNILLPLHKPTQGEGSMVEDESGNRVTVSEWMQQSMIKHHKTFMPVFPFQGAWWVRLSAQIYLDQSDFEWAGWTLKSLCEKLDDMR
jgi:selenocysteine lyase/cysteine desulfurase